MKWFKHFCDAQNSESMDAIIERFGFAGYGRWFRILEVIGSKMSKEDPRCHAEFSVRKWCDILRMRPPQLREFCAEVEQIMNRNCAETALISLRIDAQTARFEVPNLKKIMDEYSTRIGSLSGVKSPQNQNQKKELDTESEPPRSPPPVPERVLAAVKIWNEQKAEAWDYVHDPRKIKALITRLNSALKLDGFYLPDIIARARESEFLNNKRFCTLLWVVSKSTKTGNLNAQDIMAGRYEHQTTKHVSAQPGCLTDDGKNLW